MFAERTYINNNLRKKMSDLKIPDRGTITFLVGPMFSGKTTALWLLHNRCKISGLKVLTIKYTDDTRYEEDGIATHSGLSTPAIPLRYLKNIDVSNFDMIMVDEIQFFEDAVECCIQWAEGLKKRVVVAGLLGNFRRELWPITSELMPLCSHVCFFTAVCELCHKSAPFSKLIKGDESCVKQIGGGDKFRARCGTCWHN
jgi:thymidine kinase